MDEVTESRPEKIFLLIGTNDLRNKKTPEYIIQKITQITEKIRKESPNTIVYLQSLLPTYNRPERPISSIKAINEGIKKLEDKTKVFYIDLFSHFANPNEEDQLYNNLSLDGLHLNGKGYLKWKKIIENKVNDYGHLKKSLQHLKNPSDNYVFVIAHRGDWRNAPENSIQAIKGCIDMGVDAVEIDIAETKDGHIIIMHDKKLERTTNGKGAVKEKTLKEIKQLVLKDGVGRKTKYKIPTLKEALLFSKGKIILDLDVKSEIPFKKIAQILEETGTTNQVILRSYRPLKEAYAYYGNILKKLNYIPGVSKKIKNIDKYIKEFESDINPLAYAIKFEKDDAPITKFMSVIAKNKDKVWVHSITANRSGGHDDEKAITDPDNAWGWLINNGVNMIQTDRPRLLLNYLRSRGVR
ncbi:hypothetical protein JL193_04005 [Polaribacter batillariae]|uniref:GP-PDE domain-containing protein n=1 Tax=Polaribacter batillariae TaxID=2808900 RepID=A0ABX7SW30_9FLAO|nr:hypothetical protein JL193_04005 [Polaribacter batillariae]